MATRIPPHQKVDALKLKDELQEELDAKLKGLSPEEEIKKIRELEKTGPLGVWWKSLSKAKTYSSAQG